MKIVPLVLCLGLLFAVAATSEAQKTSRTSCGPDVYVNVEVRTVPTTDLGQPAEAQDPDYAGLYPAGYLLRSDGLGRYLHGVDKIEARFQVDNCSQDFTMNMNFSSRKLKAYDRDGNFLTTVSFFNFDRVASVPVTTAGSFLGSAFCTSLNTDPATPPGPNGPDNYAGCDVDGTGAAFVRRAVTMQLDYRDDQRLMMQRSPWDSFSRNLCPSDGDQRPCQTSYVRVYHPNAGTWILSPEPENTLPPAPGYQVTSPMAAHLSYSSKAGFKVLGVQHLPFRIIVTKVN